MQPSVSVAEQGACAGKDGTGCCCVSRKAIAEGFAAELKIQTDAHIALLIQKDHELANLRQQLAAAQAERDTALQLADYETWNDPRFTPMECLELTLESTLEMAPGGVSGAQRYRLREDVNAVVAQLFPFSRYRFGPTHNWRALLDSIWPEVNQTLGLRIRTLDESKAHMKTAGTHRAAYLNLKYGEE